MDICELVKVEAPWTDKQIEFLEIWQDSLEMHQYTCGNDSNHILVPTKNGWICPAEWLGVKCDYYQNWAWLFVDQKSRSKKENDLGN